MDARHLGLDSFVVGMKELLLCRLISGGVVDSRSGYKNLQKRKLRLEEPSCPLSRVRGVCTKLNFYGLNSQDSLDQQIIEHSGPVLFKMDARTGEAIPIGLEPIDQALFYTLLE